MAERVAGVERDASLRVLLGALPVPVHEEERDGVGDFELVVEKGEEPGTPARPHANPAIAVDGCFVRWTALENPDRSYYRQIQSPKALRSSHVRAKRGLDDGDVWVVIA